MTRASPQRLIPPASSPAQSSAHADDFSGTGIKESSRGLSARKVVKMASSQKDWVLGVDSWRAVGKISTCPGDVAQLGERCRRMAEAEGSTPFVSTKSRFLLRSAFFFCPQRPAFFIIRNTATMYKTQGLAILLRFVYHGSRETARICRSRRAAGISDAGVNTHHLPSIADKNNKILTAAQGNATIKTNGDATELTYKHSAASSFWIKNH